MSNEIRPPPLPSRQDDTEPGLGLLALKAENARLRSERNAARDALAETDASVPPPLPRKRTGKVVAIELGKFAVAAPVLVILGKMAAKRWPQFGELIDAILEAVGLQ